LLIMEPLPGFEAVHLMGNHDDFVLRVLTGEDPTLWLMNGGDTTLRSYGIDPLAPAGMGRRDEWLREQLAARLPDEHLAFLRGLRTMHTEGDYVFVHAGVRPGVPIAIQEPKDLLWIREPFLNSRADHGKVVVHGHTPSEAPEVRANRIGIDTGACYGGKLTALVLEGSDRAFLQA
ncbi:MAG TPA: serine/threonine protein phosphatase, partial [Pseudomonadales bacterium]|nr:serine/threonine protein phosphatase [Pseudomonadales bacterium]